MAYKKRKRKFSSKNGKVSAKTKKFFDDFKEDEGVDPTNDPSWYAMYPDLMRDAASIPYSIPTGTKVNYNIVGDPTVPVPTADDVYYTAYESVPGIATFGVVPTPGISNQATSPVNISMKMLYTKVRAENSGRANYDAPDLMLYCLAMDQIYSLITWYNRIYGTMMLYSQVNRYMPKALLEAQWVDFDDLILHINDFKAFLDTATAQAAVFSVPNDMKLFNRHTFMYQNVYKDAESPKSQLYQFAPRVFYQYDEMSGNAGYLKAIDVISFAPNKFKFSDLTTLYYTMINPIIASEDFNIMSGDILKAFGEGNLIKLQIMPQGYTIIPIADYEVLTQMKNATITSVTNTMLLSISSDPMNWAIKQDANVEYLEYDPYLTKTNTARKYYIGDRLLSTYKTTPEPSDNMVYTRLMYCIEERDLSTSGQTLYECHFDSVGSEFISGVNISLFHFDANNDWVCEDAQLQVLSENLIFVSQGSVAMQTLARMYMLKHFDYIPAVYLFVKESASATKTMFLPIFDLDNWTVVHAYELEKMHRTALMSMMRVPMIGSALPSGLRG